MQKSNFLAAGIVLLLAGCHTPSSTDAWRKVSAVRKNTGSRAERTGSYSADVHSVLKSANIEHKVVTFDYQWDSRFSGEQTATRTVVLYRDPQTPRSPWWLADESLRSPVWMPDTSVEKQVSFYVRRHAKVIEAREFGVNAKGVKPLEKPARKVAISRIEPVGEGPAKRKPTREAAPTPAPEKPEPKTTIKKSAGELPPAKSGSASRAKPDPVPTAKPLLIDQPDEAPLKVDPDILSDPKPLPPAPAAQPNASARPNFFRRILAALTGIFS